MIILGIDPGTRACGFGVIEVNGSVVRAREYGVIRANEKLPLAERLAIIYDGVTEILAGYKPDLVGIEESFFGKNAATALVLGHGRGVILLAVQKSGATFLELSATQVKKTVVGNGHATKDQVEFMVRALLKLPQDKIKDDAFDALAIALTANNFNSITYR